MDLLDFYNKNGIAWSSELKKHIQTEECQLLTVNLVRYTDKAFKDIHQSMPENIRDRIWLHPQLNITALHSAYLDLKQAEFIHKMEGGPAEEKMAAAAMAWLAIIKPIQVAKTLHDQITIFLNARFALEVGFAILTHVHYKRTGVLHEGAVGLAREVINEMENPNSFIYALIWRAPGFRELSLLLEHIFKPQGNVAENPPEPA